METVSKMKYSRTDRLVLGIGYAILGLFVLSIVVPLVYVVLASFMDPTVLNNQGLSFHIKDWTLDAYRRVLENGMIWRGFLNSFLYSLAFAAISVFVTLLAAYPMSKKEFVGRKFFNVIFLITMFFGGGMIPTFILINQLHMVNTVWAILIPGVRRTFVHIETLILSSFCVDFLSIFIHSFPFEICTFWWSLYPLLSTMLYNQYPDYQGFTGVFLLPFGIGFCCDSQMHNKRSYDI